jgi:hypothetical protein
MHRFFGLMALTAAGLGLYLLFGSDDAATPKGASAQALDNAPIAYGVWAVGLLMGLTLAWLAGVEWSTLPTRATLWVKLQRRRFGWALFGGLFAAILLLF